MPENDERAFDITPTPASVQLDDKGGGEVSFTVTSKKGRLRVRARIEPQDPSHAEWYELVGEQERTLDTTDTFVVKLKVPEAAPPGDYTFHLRVVSEVNPDEDFTDSAPVGFTVEPREEEKKPFPWWIIAVIAGVLIVGGLVAWLLLRETKAELGGDCTEKECEEGLVCSDENVCVGPLGFAGCRDTEDCEAGLTCEIEEGAETGTCLAGLQGACEETEQCAGDLTCDEGACRGGEGFSPCTAAADCVGDLFCAGGTCVGDTTGLPCVTDRSCAEGQRCLEVSGTKLCMRKTGQPCEAFQQCASLLCQNGVCTSLPNGAACTNAAQCQSNRCINGRCQEPLRCGPNQPCPSGFFCLRAVNSLFGRCITNRIVVPGNVLQEMKVDPDRLRRRPGGG